ncbi:MAG TPA: ribosomal protein L7/L12 [Thermoguttaceae bacterium]|nr:ribosomal protein L7/L12 [Thermoguttaceae bacterium]
MPTDDANRDAELQALVAAGRKIEAIKRYRELTGAGLAEAKNAVESLMRGASLPSREQGDVPFESEIVSLLEQGRKIDAIKLYREKTGVGLKEAKDFIEALAADRRIAAPSRSGCLGVVLVVAAVLLMIVAKSFAAEDRETALKQDQLCRLIEKYTARESRQSDLSVSHTASPHRSGELVREGGPLRVEAGCRDDQIVLVRPKTGRIYADSNLSVLYPIPTRTLGTWTQ